MIAITRAQARLLWSLLRKSAPIEAGRSYLPTLSLQTSQEGLLIRAHHADVSVEWQLPGPRPNDKLALNSKALDDFEGAKEAVVELTLKDTNVVQAYWHDGGVPQCKEYLALCDDKLLPFPVEPAKFAKVGSAFLKTLDEAARTTARSNVRFAVTKLQLRGLSGELIGTDGKQLLVQRGFPLPWKEDVLIAAISVYGSKELSQESSVAIGRSNTHVCVRVGAWKFYHAIDKEARFPRIENVIPSPLSKGTTLKLTPEDASSLAQALPHLPGNEEDFEAVTVDLHGRVAVRARQDPQSRPTELLLSHAEVFGPPLQFVCARQYLARALNLGFTEFCVKKDVPVVCRDPKRIYVFMPLSGDGAVPACKDALRIESTTDKTEIQQPFTPRSMIPMPAPQPPNGHVTHGTPEPISGRTERGPTFIDLLSEAEELRTVVMDASARLSRLISGLKQHRRQSRAVQDAVRSLKQLKLDA